ncbi:MAG: hypothetical protein KGP28_10920 [Bdellovibrionales bacterium]|nr:hypothetical protein [Bdellovibrionales bacterium]
MAVKKKNKKLTPKQQKAMKGGLAKVCAQELTKAKISTNVCAQELTKARISTNVCAQELTKAKIK